MEHGHERRDDLRKVLFLGEIAATSSLIGSGSSFSRIDFPIGRQVLIWLGDLTWKLRLFYGTCAYRRSRKSMKIDEKSLRPCFVNALRGKNAIFSLSGATRRRFWPPGGAPERSRAPLAASRGALGDPPGPSPPRFLSFWAAAFWSNCAWPEYSGGAFYGVNGIIIIYI